jgi:hypothetical protein
MIRMIITAFFFIPLYQPEVLFVTLKNEKTRNKSLWFLVSRLSTGKPILSR